MTVRKMQRTTWQRLIEAGDPSTQDYSEGPSPGGAAAELGCSRQAVHELIRRGVLDALAVHDGDRLSHYTISVSSLASYKAERQARILAQLKAIP